VPVIGNITPIQTYDAADLDLVLVELDLGATFCGVALSTRDHENRSECAQRSTSLRQSPTFLTESKSPRRRAGTINEKCSLLNGLLERLGVRSNKARLSEKGFALRIRSKPVALGDSADDKDTFRRWSPFPKDETRVEVRQLAQVRQREYNVHSGFTCEIVTSTSGRYSSQNCGLSFGRMLRLGC
jgi:hypothetical protein